MALLRVSTLVVWVYLMNSSFGWAAGVSNRPTNSNSASAIEKDSVEVSYGIDWQKKPNNDKATLMILDLTYGLAKNTELGFKFPYVFNDPNGGDQQSGLGQSNIFFLWNFIEEEENNWKPGISLSSQLFVKPTGYARRTDTNGEDIDFFLITSKYFGKHNLLLNIGTTLYGDENAGLRDTFHYQFADEWQVSSWMTLIAEVYGKNRATIGERNHEISFQGGSIFLLSKKLAFDFGVSVGLTHAAPDWLVRSGLTYSFNN